MCFWCRARYFTYLPVRGHLGVKLDIYHRGNMWSELFPLDTLLTVTAEYICSRKRREQTSSKLHIGPTKHCSSRCSQCCRRNSHSTNQTTGGTSAVTGQRVCTKNAEVRALRRHLKAAFSSVTTYSCHPVRKTITSW